MVNIIYPETIPVYRGDIINSHSPNERQPDPERMLQAYDKSKCTM
jgi:3-deoxy-D-arabino-heptulosonate 7-phosphate (DAHP) synthase class II